jgi:predicted dehydrogenase
MLNIAIIGCGQIGSRHLQGLKTISGGANVYLVDVSSQSIDVALRRFYETNMGDKFTLQVRLINQIDCDIDCAIISTDSSARSFVTEQLLQHTKVKNIMFEKFLFQTKSEYTFISKLLKDNQVTAWVNQWMSSLPAFKEMFTWFKGDLELIDISGVQWGLAGNAVHFIDYFHYISNREELKLISTNLDADIIQSKRSGYLELTGSLMLENKEGLKLSLDSQNGVSDGIINICMHGNNKKLNAKLTSGLLKCSYFDKFSDRTEAEYIIPLQSAMTGNVIDDICLYNDCSLPTYDESVFHHMLVFDSYNEVFQGNDNNQIFCPIT